MPTITGPDGRKLRVPDGASQEQINQVIAQVWPDARQRVAPAPTSAQPEALAPAQANFAGVDSNVDSSAEVQTSPLAESAAAPSTGGMSPEQFRSFVTQNQAGYDPAASAAADLANRQQGFAETPLPLRFAAGAGSRVADAAMAAGQMLGLTNQQDAATQRENNRFMEGDAAASAGKLAGDVGLLAAPGGLASKVPTLAGRLGLNSLLGAVYGALSPTVEGESRLQNTSIGAISGLGGAAAGEGLGALASRARSAVDPVKQGAIKLAEKAGIPLHVSQISDSIPVKTMASMAKYLPFSGAGKAAGNQQQAFNRAVGQTFGADAGKLTDDVMRNARRDLGKQYEEIYNRSEVRLTPDALKKLNDAETEVAGRLTTDEAAVIRKQLNRILGEVNESGALTGQKYQALRSKIMAAEGGDRVGSAVKEVRKALDDIAADSVGPEDAAKLKDLRSKWANMRTTEDLLKQVAGAGGDVAPARLWAAIRNGSTKEMRELARLGQTVLKDPIPDSGTAGRLLSLGALGTGSVTGALPGIAGLLGAGATVGRALNSPTAARLLANRTPGSGLAALARIAPVGGIVATPLDRIEPKPRKRLDDR